jgi:flagellar assembly factor FliW
MTKAYGLIEIDEEQRIVFPNGFFGFEHCINFVFIEAERKPFFYLQSIDDENVAFILIDPFLFEPDYEADIDNKELETIGIFTPEDVIILVVVTIPGNDGVITANLQGPVIINRVNRNGKQVILSDPRWKTKHSIILEAVQPEQEC